MNRSFSFHHLYLTGYRGSGKTSLGKWLGARLSRPVIDLDDRIEEAAGCSIREIFEQEGETGFRDRETDALRHLSGEPESVVSLGGGAILRDENRKFIAATGYCIWLQVDADTVLRRLAQDNSTAARRPALTTLPPREEIEALLAARKKFYVLAADVAIEVVGKDIDSIGAESIEAIRGQTVA